MSDSYVGFAPTLLGGDHLRSQLLDAVVQLVEPSDDPLHLGDGRAHLLEIRVVVFDDIHLDPPLDALHFDRLDFLLDGGDAAGEEGADGHCERHPNRERERVSNRTHCLPFPLKVGFLKSERAQETSFIC